MVLDIGFWPYANEDTKSQREWTPGGVPTRTLDLEGGGHWVVCHVSWAQK